MTKKLNIALVTDVLPDPRFTAGQVLEKIVSNTPQADFDVFWLNQSRLGKSRSLPANVRKIEAMGSGLAGAAAGRSVKRMLMLPFHLTLRVAKLVAGKVYSSLKKTAGKKIPEKIVGRLRAIHGIVTMMPRALGIWRWLRPRLKKSEYDAVWMVLQGESLALAYTLLVREIKMPVILQQWDPISWWSYNHGHGRLIARVAGIMVRALEERAYANLVPSYTWQKDQTARGPRSLRLDNFFAAGELKTPPPKPVGAVEINAVFIGQPYAWEELMEILRRLREEAERLGKRLVMHYYGGNSLNLGRRGVAQISHAFATPGILISEIAQYDVALLPYPLTPAFAETARFSFPSKSKMYLAAGLPILALCPLDSSPHLFYKQYYGDHYLNFQEGGHLASFVERAVKSSPEAATLRLEAARRVIEEHFSIRAELQPFHDMLEGLQKARA